jgi:hypothetical protein
VLEELAREREARPVGVRVERADLGLGDLGDRTRFASSPKRKDLDRVLRVLGLDELDQASATSSPGVKRSSP